MYKCDHMVVQPWDLKLRSKLQLLWETFWNSRLTYGKPTTTEAEHVWRSVAQTVSAVVPLRIAVVFQVFAIDASLHHFYNT